MHKVVEFVLYLLWDLGFKVGHTIRIVDECIRLSKSDMAIRIAILEVRAIYGQESLTDDLKKQFESEVVTGAGTEFIAVKLAKHDQRYRKAGDTRYPVEPNVKEGKSSLCDLQTFFWIAKYYYHICDTVDLVKLGVLSKSELKLFDKDDDSLWVVRCQIHLITGKVEGRSPFDIQCEIADALNCQPCPGLSVIERFMKHYFLVAKDMGELTRIVCAALEDKQAKDRLCLSGVLGRFVHRVRKTSGLVEFIEDWGRIVLATPDAFKNDPVNLIRLFHIADIKNLVLHPDALRVVTRSLSRINDKLRENEEANHLFLLILTSWHDPALTRRRMNEAGALSKFIPEFGKIVAMMQFNIYHHYTVDEHLIRSVGVLSEVDKETAMDVHPLANQLTPGVEEREVLCVAVLLHDVAKGRSRRTIRSSARAACKFCQHFLLTGERTKTVVWLIEQHLLMSMVTKTRDLHNCTTITNFADKVQSMEQLKMVLILTVCDIRTVSSGVWNGWKGYLLLWLYYETELLLSGDFSGVSREERAQIAWPALYGALNDWGQETRRQYTKLHYEPYFLTVALEDKVRYTRFIREADKQEKAPSTILPSVISLKGLLNKFTLIEVKCLDRLGFMSDMMAVIVDLSLDIHSARIPTCDEKVIDTVIYGIIVHPDVAGLADYAHGKGALP